MIKIIGSNCLECVLNRERVCWGRWCGMLENGMNQEWALVQKWLCHLPRWGRCENISLETGVHEEARVAMRYIRWLLHVKLAVDYISIDLKNKFNNIIIGEIVTEILFKGWNI